MQELYIDLGPHSLHVEVAADVDFDGRFPAKCLDTGETLQINGWLIESIEKV